MMTPHIVELHPNIFNSLKRPCYVYEFAPHKKIDSFILEDGIRILTAKEPYNMNLPFQKELHDTHIKSSGGDYFLKNDSEDYKNLQTK